MREAAGQGDLAINRHLLIEIAGPDAELRQDNVFRYVVAAKGD